MVARTKRANGVAASAPPVNYGSSVFRIISSVTGIVLHILLIVYLVELDVGGCECSESSGWKPNAIKYLIVMSILTVPLTLFLRLRPDITLRLWRNGSLKMAGGAVIVLGIVKAYAMLNYSLELYDCECANDWRRAFLLWEGVLGALAYFLFFAMMVYYIYRIAYDRSAM